MTEVERILNLNFLPHDFLKPEILCDFLVDENRKKIWAVELDLLRKFDTICSKYDLKYFLIGGSLLGAVRHNGIIPWDDDIDVGMFRNDYDKFLQLTNEFNDPYFLQTPHTDPKYAYSFARLRNSNTTCVPKMFMYQDYNHGLYLDIFPFENWIEEDGEEVYNRIHKLCLENSTYMRLANPNLDEKNKERVANWCGKDNIEVYDEIQRLAKSYINIRTDKICKVVFTYHYCQELYPREYFEEIIRVNFNGLQIPIPIHYDEILTRFFGDYLTFPPIEQRNGGHPDVYFNADICYKEYLKEHR